MMTSGRSVMVGYALSELTVPGNNSMIGSINQIFAGELIGELCLVQSV
jgi:hypothetical protein